MSKAAFGALTGIATLLTLSIGLVVLFRPDVVEMRSQALLVAHVRSELARDTNFGRDPRRQTEVKRVLADACHHCSPRRPEFVPQDAPFEVQVAVRSYVGTLLNFFVGILSLLMINLLSVLVATLAGRSQPVPPPCATAVIVAVTVSEVLGFLVYLIAPVPIHFVLLRWPLNFPLGWGLVLGVSVTFCAVHRSTRAPGNPNR